MIENDEIMKKKEYAEWDAKQTKAPKQTAPPSA